MTAVLLAACLLVSCAADNTGDTSAETAEKTAETVAYNDSYLQNTYHCLAEDGRLNIAFIGGSITVGVGASSYEKCWAGNTEKWFRDNFPDAEINAVNAAFGGIGTDFNAFRAYSELHLSEQGKAPDLLFVECSINDRHIETDDATVKGYTEAMIRMMNEYAPECDIVYVFTSDYWRGNGDFPERLAAMEVLDAYGIRYINVGTPLFDKIIAENGGEMPAEPYGELMSKYFLDGVHPTDAGYAVYSSVVGEWLDGTLTAKYPLDKSAHSAHVIPTDAMFGGYSTELSCTDFAQFANLLDGWENGGSCLNYYGNTSFTFTFTGTAAYIWADSFPDGCTYTFVIDGEASSKRASMKKQNQNCYLVRAADGLEYGQHTVVVTVAGNNPHARIYGICVAGDETHAGASLTADK